MIGVIAKSGFEEATEEFFQLFKTPWEFYNPGRDHYDVLIITDNVIPDTNASLIVVYGVGDFNSHENTKIETIDSESHPYFQLDDLRVPVYGNAVTFETPEHPVLFCSEFKSIIGYELPESRNRIIRLGYDLFSEVSFLLTEGQPIQNALIPTLDIHVDMLRRWIIGTGIELVEIPPAPSGYNFIACLTHDVDFVGIRNHPLDHSMGGFLYRATLGSLIDVFRKRRSTAELFENLKAVLTLPFVFAGIHRDPWDQFDRYLELEGGSPSTFFFIPYKNRAGKGFDQKKDRYRAAKYDVKDVEETIVKLRSNGCEVGVHGIDSWHSAEFGRQERNRLMASSGQKKAGIRMHWLCMDQTTYGALDKAGYQYDSTFGYNEAVGFRAGTSQVYKPIGAKKLMEVPLHIQDTALFNPKRMNITAGQAGQMCDQLIENACTHKGVLTILWHQRSTGPERLWGAFYQTLIGKMRDMNAWFATAGDAAQWFAIRRSTVFSPNGKIHLSDKPDRSTPLPKLIQRTYKWTGSQDSNLAFVDQEIES